MAYKPHHYPECCVSNIGRAMPNYVLRMYQKTKDGICASLYGDSVYDDGEIRLEQSGGYPFSSKTMFLVRTKNNKKLMLRIPAWTKGYSLKVNGKEKYLDEINGYVSLNVADSDRIFLHIIFIRIRSGDTR